MATSIAPHMLAPQLLAYIGDGVFESHVRILLLPVWPRIETLHRQTVSRVRAERQAELLTIIQPHLTDDEADIVRRGRNAKTSAKRKDLFDYRYATAFEALIGYLHLDGQLDRLAELWVILDPHLLAIEPHIRPTDMVKKP
ncbi:MAG: ribonuclease III [Candidatus Sericytochromatia bacterium]|nr:ribonuclease III [Candidatus Sericytochromatia bacterium]